MQTTKTIPPLTAADAAATVVVGAAALALYLRTLVPYPLPGDSGEFQVLVHQLGAAHTTGYSTYLLLGHLFEQLVPWGDVAWRVNLFSAVMGALAAALVYLAGKLLTGSGPAAVVGALSLSVGFTFWSQAIIAEVYTLNAALLALALAAAVVLAGCSGNLGAPEAVTKQGEEFTTLWKGFLVTAALIGLLVYGLIIYAALRYRRRKGDDPDKVPSQYQYQVPLEVTYTVVPIIIVVFLFAFTVIGENRITRTDPDPDLTVQVVGFQW
ncbi:MAG: DUF2723 domain-containing protein, partial [Caldilineaceae bacterium]|nr:DUF2723 domain-containing protein [Caldilineaceae bacterium]